MPRGQVPGPFIAGKLQDTLENGGDRHHGNRVERWPGWRPQSMGQQQCEQGLVGSAPPAQKEREAGMKVLGGQPCGD